jgi:hypothetical protein
LNGLDGRLEASTKRAIRLEQLSDRQADAAGGTRGLPRTECSDAFLVVSDPLLIGAKKVFDLAALDVNDQVA